jgi:hypothetical protein
MEQIATKRDSRMQRDLAAPKDSITVTENTSAASDTEDSEDADDDTAKNPAARKIETPKTIWGDPRRSVDSKLKRVILPVSNRTEETAQPARTSQRETKPPQRPRRVAGN